MLRIALKCRPYFSYAHTIFATTLPWAVKPEFLMPFASAAYRAGPSRAVRLSLWL
jgi:hypothetical protein